MRLLLLMDVDGVLALLGPGTHEPCFEAVAGEFPVSIAEATPGRVLRIAKVFQLVWATSWQRQASEDFGPLLGLSDDLPFLRFDRSLDHPGSSYKLPAIQRFVRDRPTAFVDDELGHDVLTWAEERAQPTLLIQPDPRLGLTDDHVDKLLAFQRRVRAESGNVEGPHAV